jgi:hypothetical protein
VKISREQGIDSINQEIPVALSYNADIVTLPHWLKYWLKAQFFHAEKDETCVFVGNCSRHGYACCSDHLMLIKKTHFLISKSCCCTCTYIKTYS